MSRYQKIVKVCEYSFYLIVLVQKLYCDGAKEKNFKILLCLICKLFAKALSSGLACGALAMCLQVVRYNYLSFHIASIDFDFSIKVLIADNQWPCDKSLQTSYIIRSIRAELHRDHNGFPRHPRHGMHLHKYNGICRFDIFYLYQQYVFEDPGILQNPIFFLIHIL